jgi:uncharacterized membrane protein YkvA (DUF1232 family)
VKFLKKIKARATELKLEALTLGLAVGHPRTPWYAKILVAGLVAYIVTPVDLIPDFIPVLGLVDDILFIPVAIWLATKFVPKDVLAECRTRALAVAEGARMRRLGRILVISLWAFVVMSVAALVYYAA